MLGQPAGQPCHQPKRSSKELPSINELLALSATTGSRPDLRSPEVTRPPRAGRGNRHRRNSSSRPSSWTEVGLAALQSCRHGAQIAASWIASSFIPAGGAGQDWSASCTAIEICTRLVTSSLVNNRDTCALTVASLRNSAAPTSALEAPDPIATAT